MVNFNIVHNLAYKNIDTNVNVLYAPTNNTFDLLVKSLDINTYNIKQRFGNYYYDLFWTNNFLEHTQQTISLVKQIHLLDVVWFHNNPPLKFKKEDIVLVSQHLRNSIKICADASIMQAWGFDHDTETKVIPYGIMSSDIDYSNKTESILLLNFNNNTDITNLYEFIKQDFPAAVMINSLDHVHSLNELYSIIAKYHICIDIYNSLNVLIAQYLGCKVITSTEQAKQLIGVIQLSDYGNIKEVLQSALNDNLSHTDILSNRNWIQETYNYQTFHNSVMSILSEIKTKEFFTI